MYYYYYTSEKYLHPSRIDFPVKLQFYKLVDKICSFLHQKILSRVNNNYNNNNINNNKD